MIEQQGQAVDVSAGRVRVRVGGKSGCSACDAGKGCGAGVFGRLLNRQPVYLEFDNSVNAEPGQAVVLGLPEGLFLRLLSRFYLYPLLSGLLGAVLAHVLAARLEIALPWSDLVTLAGAILLAAPVFWFMRAAATEFPARHAVHLLRVVNAPSNVN